MQSVVHAFGISELLSLEQPQSPERRIAYYRQSNYDIGTNRSAIRNSQSKQFSYAPTNDTAAHTFEFRANAICHGAKSTAS